MKKIIILEGIDKSGKNTIKKEFHKLTNYNYVIVDRFIASNWVYSIFHEREDRLDEYFELDNKLDKSIFVLVYLYADKKDIIKRIKQTKEKDIKLKDIDYILSLYDAYLKTTSFDYISINTSLYTPQFAALKIWKQLQNM